MTGDISFRDALYGRIALPGWLRPALSLPEFARLRGVRQSNLDGIEHKDFSNPSRWSHAIGAAYLACVYSTEKHLPTESSVRLLLATLLHDVATPPFAHTAESVLPGFDHETETFRVLAGIGTPLSDPGFPVYQSELGQFAKLCKSVGKLTGVKVNAEAVAELVVGQGDLGFLVSGTIDLDNADNVTRALFYLGEQVDRELPIRLAKWLARRDHRPLDIRTIPDPDLQEWISYKDKLYALFHYATLEEVGRQAFLEHLMRRALNEGLPAETLLWSTDEQLLDLLHTFTEARKARPTLRSLVSRYRLLDSPTPLGAFPLTESASLVFRNPDALQFIEDALSDSVHEVCVTVQRPRFKISPSLVSSLGQFVTEPRPTIYVFSLSGKTRSYAPEMLRDFAGVHGPGKRGRAAADALADLLPQWAEEKPWTGDESMHKARSLSVALDSVGDWSFRLTRNESIHAYPSTFVHALPSTLIRALGLRGSAVLDPFCGTGQTAIATLRTAASAYLADINRVALLVASARFTYLTPSDRKFLSSIKEADCENAPERDLPELPNVTNWHHRHTQTRLHKLLSIASSAPNDETRLMLTATFSSILVNTTARKGKQHGFFADNTPLPKGLESPPFIDPFPLFLSRLKRNVEILEKTYSEIERDDRDPRQELARVRIRRADARSLVARDFGIDERSIDAIVTSPPYLGAADYSLGNRLSYYWLFPDAMKEDFAIEVGARRRRFHAKVALESYVADLTQFAEASRRILRKGGLLVTILGEPSAAAFKSSSIIATIEKEWRRLGFELIWQKWRELQWHRNFGYERIRKERIGVYRLVL